MIPRNPAFPFYRHSLENPEAIALVLGEREFTYATLAPAIKRIAGWVTRSLADRRQGRVGILASRTLETYLGILGASWAGATYIPINPKSPTQALRRILELARLDVLICDADGARKYAETGLQLPCPVLSSAGPLHAAPEDEAHPLHGVSPLETPVEMSPEQTAYVIFTSGTTGTPKGVRISAGSLRCFIDHCQQLYKLTPEDRVSNFSEVSFDFSILDLWVTWNAGASLHVVPESQLIAPARFIREHRLTFWASVPSVIVFLQKLKFLKDSSFPTLRATFFCGEALPLSSALAWQRAAPNSVIDNHYGPTEVTVACSFDRLSDPPNLTPGRDVLSIGRPYPGMRMGIIDETGTFLPADQPGELVLSGPQVTQGYLDDPEMTARRLRQLNHPSLGRTTWYLTGDSALVDTRGAFHHLGRLDHQIKVLGHRVELEELDTHLRQVCGSDSVAMVAWPVKDGTADGVVAFVSGTSLSTGEILTGLKQRLPSFVVPTEILLLDALPLSSNGKIDRKALSQRLAARDREHER